jgi:hypothetical protein
MSLICSKIQGRSCRLASAFILPASACLSLSNSITSLLRFWSKAFPPSLFQIYFQRGDLAQSDLAETAFEGLVRPIMSFFHVPGPRPKKRPGTMLVRHSCQFIHFYLAVPQEGVSWHGRGAMVYVRCLKRVAVHHKGVFRRWGMRRECVKER